MKCSVCKRYTLNEKHCNEKTLRTEPGKYSPLDPFAKYRRKAKKEILKEKGLY